MGEALYAQLREDRADIACRTYAPVGSHKDLLAYLVRRLLENGANSSFVAVASETPFRSNVVRGRPSSSVLPPITVSEQPPSARSLSAASCELARHRIRRSRGAERTGCSDRRRGPRPAAGSIADASQVGAMRQSPLRSTRPKDGAGRRPQRRAAILEHAANLLEERRAHLIELLVREGGKTLDDALSEFRETVDFCRYYAARRPQTFRLRPRHCPGRPARTMFCVCVAAASSWRSLHGIFRWRFLRADDGGADGRQCRGGKARLTHAADRGGVVRLLHEAGVPASECIGALRRRIGAALVAHPDIAGVVFTGSTEAADRSTGRWPRRTAPIVPLIAEPAVSMR